MPMISTFYGIVIYMYWANHPPPHVHAIYGGEEAIVSILNGPIVAGSLSSSQFGSGSSSTAHSQPSNLTPAVSAISSVRVDSASRFSGSKRL